MELSIEKFNPKKVELTSLAQEAKLVELADPFDAEELVIVQDTNKRLVKARNDIKRAGLEMRDEANRFRTQVLDLEKEYLAIIEPEEKRIKSLLDLANKAIERKARTELIPARRAKLDAIGDGLEVSDDELLDMDGSTFEAHANMRLANKNEADRRIIAEAQKKIEEEKAEIQKKKDIQEAEERGRKEAAEKIKMERIENEKKQVVSAPIAIPKVEEKNELPVTKQLGSPIVDFLEEEYKDYVKSLETDEDYGKPTALGFKEHLVNAVSGQCDSCNNGDFVPSADHHKNCKLSYIPF